MTRSAFPGQCRSPRIASIRLPAPFWNGIRFRRAPGPPTTIAAPRTKASIRIRSASASIIGFPQSRSGVRPAHSLRGDFVPGHATSGAVERPHVGTLGPQHTVAGRSRPTISASSRQCCERASRRRHATHRRPIRRATERHAVDESGSAGHSVDREIPEYAADVPHRRLSAARIAAEHRLGFRHERDADRRFAHLAEGTAHAQGGRRPALGAAECHPAAVADRARSPSATSSAICRASANTGTPLASFLLGQVQQFSIDLAAGRDPEPRALPGVLHPGRLAGVRSRDHQCRRALHAELPVHRREQPGRLSSISRREQLEYLGRDGQPRAARQLHKLNFGPRLGIVGRLTDKTVARTGYGARLDRDGGHHDAVHDAGLSVPADGVAADARQHHAGVHARRRPERRADSADAERRPGPGRVFRRSRSRLWLCPAVERVRSARAHVEHRGRGRVCRVRRSRASAFPTRT